MYFYCYVYAFLLLCMFCFHHANWHSAAILTEVFLCFFLSCQGITHKDGARPALFPVRLLIVLFLLLFVLFYTLFVCNCVLYYSYRVSTQLQLTNISYHIIIHFSTKVFYEPLFTNIVVCFLLISAEKQYDQLWCTWKIIHALDGTGK